MTRADRHGSPAGFRTDIQGLRAIAVLLVVAYHTGVLPVSGGYVGVDVFFVISGALITGAILRDLERTGRIRLADFWARRVRRILPASLVVAALTVIAVVLFTPPVLQGLALGDALWTVLYVPNVALALRGTDYLAESAPTPFQHYWSLGVEEQFYLVLPLLLLLSWRLTRGRRHAVLAILVVAVVASFAFGIWLTYRSQPWAFFSLPSRAWELGVGSIVAFVGARWGARIPAAVAAVVGWAGLALIAVAGFVFDDGVVFPGVAAAVPVLGAAAVILAGESAGKAGPGVVLSVRPLQFLGLISYSWYLVHWPLMVIPASRGSVEPWLVLVTAAAGVLLAWGVHRLVENPVRYATWLTDHRPARSLVAALAATTLVAGLVLVAGALDQRGAYSSDKSAPQVEIVDPDGAATDAPPTFTAYVPSDLRPGLDVVADDIPRIYPDACHLDVPSVDVRTCSYGDLESDRVVALFGDSHAAQWFPSLESLAVKYGFRLDTYTKSSCPSVDVPILVYGVPYTECDRWRSAVIEQLAADPPDLVVISNMSDQPDQATGGIQVDAWADGLRAVLERLPSRALVIGDTPRFTANPAICLSVNLTDTQACAAPRAAAVLPAWAEAESRVATEAGDAFLSVTDRLCDASTCGLIIGDVLLYRDDNHLTATAARELAPVLWRALSGMLPP